MIALIDYGSGNLRSAEKALVHAGGKVHVTHDPKTVLKADKIVLPGVGTFGDCRAGLLAISGMMDALTETVIQQKKPFLGICVGMQLMATLGHEHGTHEGFGWIEGEIANIKNTQNTLRVPHMGWNNLEIAQTHDVLKGIENGDHVYFVHSYHMVLQHQKNCLATVNYGEKLTAMVVDDNKVGTQFHPEKSQKTGLRILENFIKW